MTIKGFQSDLIRSDSIRLEIKFTFDNFSITIFYDVFPKRLTEKLVSYEIFNKIMVYRNRTKNFILSQNLNFCSSNRQLSGRLCEFKN